ncbi:MAG: PSD1 and planctomycete cytochrome C domain-containing protein [Verrucomicrobiales bacterium]
MNAPTAAAIRLATAIALALSFAITAGSSRAAEGGFSEGEQLFALKVKPLLAQKCFSCHGDDPAKIKGELDLTTREGALRGGESSASVLVPGDAKRSLLYVSVTWEDPDYEMPPKKNDRLTRDEQWAIFDWINAGAPWPDEARLAQIREKHGEGVIVQTSGGLTEDWNKRRYKPEDLWAYQPVQPTPVPEGENAVDYFIGARLAEANLEPAPSADRRTLIRRAAFDLTGLPPTPAEVDAFLGDPAPDAEAFAKLVERYLESPHYGEQWGRHWLDVARYADSAGFSNDYERPNAWRYRDYVVRAFNRDLPYDQFIREQIAGDEIDAADPEKLVAAGFLRMGPWEHTGMSVAKVTRQQFLDDVTDSVGQVFLAQPLQCCRCHDHKFDPVPTRDYYAIQAVFATAQFADRDAAFLAEENRGGFAEKAYLEARLERYDAVAAAIEAKEAAAAKAWYAERGLEFKPRKALEKAGVPEDQIAPKRIGLTPEDNGLERIARKNSQRHRWELDRYRPVAFSVFSGKTDLPANVQGRTPMPPDPMAKGELEETCILAGGDPFSPQAKVAPGVLSAAGPAAEIPAAPAGRRRAFADWVASAENPLTARVMANRIWLHHFGRAIAGTPNNFGVMGKKPTHPELLDWLAAEFVARGWSVKAMHRLIMNSEAYRRAPVHPDPNLLTKADPKGELYAAFAPRRLTAEELRDAMLAASGELNPAIGGIPVRPDMNLEAAFQPRQVMGTYAPAYQPNPQPAQRNRRSLYALKLRGQRDPFMEVFNQPGPDGSCERRESSTITPQAFALFNSAETLERAAALALRAADGSPDRASAIRRAFALAFARPPTEAEIADCLAHWEAMGARHRSIRVDPPAFPAEIERRAVDELSGEPFTFREPLDIMADYVPDKGIADLPPDLRGLAEVCLVLLNANEFAYVY